MTTENSYGMKEVGPSNVFHVSRKLFQCIDVVTPKAGDVAEVTF